MTENATPPAGQPATRGQRAAAPSPDRATQAAMQHLGSGRTEAARQLCREALAIQPDHAGALHGLGLAHYLEKDYPTAVEHLRRAVAIDRDNPQYLANLAEALRRAKQPDEALRAFERVTIIMPEHLKAHLGVANSLRDLGRIAEAVARFRLILAIDPAFAEAYHYMALCLIDQKREKEALGLLKKAVSLRPNYAEAQLALAHALDQLGEVDAAVAVYRSVLEHDPKNIAALNNVANALKSLGRFDEAIGYYREALAVTPDHTMAYYNLSRSAAARPDDAEMARMLELLEDPKLAAPERMGLHYALGKLFDDLGKADEAFDHYSKAKALDDRGEAFDPDAHDGFIDRLIETFSADFFARRQSMGTVSDHPLFIVGMPRSGTTLIEQIVSSHPAVYGAGELDNIGAIVASIGKKYDGIAAWPECARNLDAIGAITLAENYIEAVQAKAVRTGDGKTRHATDKMPFNYLHLGVIALLFPNTRIVHCRRNAMDNCLSCYFQYFTSVMNFTGNLENLGRYYRSYQRLMEHWQQVLPVPMLTLDYEETVADAEAASRRLIDFLGLEWDDACLGFQDSARPVKTASVWQVRQPIYTTSVGRAQAYAECLSPLRTALGL